MAAEFLKVTPKQAEAKVLAILNAAVKSHERVLWLVPGGSGIPIVARIMSGISEPDSAKLAIILTDERFGPVGSPDSNLQQLSDAGFAPKQATVVPVLRPSLPLEETTKLYGEAARTAFEAADYSIGLFGMGADGHIAGILPESPAVTAGKVWTVDYQTKEFLRITLTPFAISHLSEAVIMALGEPKKLPALENLKKKVDVKKQPAQLLKKLPKFTVLNDQLGDKT